MKINSKLVLELRTAQCWSQEELALAAGLNIRTVQRIESDGTASLQSKKALASALEIDFHDLDFKEVSQMKQYEFKTLELGIEEGFLAGLKKPKLPDFSALLNKEGREGWMLVQILTPELAQNVWVAKTGAMVALLQREVRE